MNKLLIALVFSLAFVFSGFSQGEKLSDYSFIVVPKKFDFQFSEDQYQLNSLLKFLFNKHGFHAYFDEELPDVRRCDGLRAEVIGNPGFVWCRVTIFIKDCEGNVIYTSEEGKSKLKEYSKMYNQAMRRAFESIDVLFVQQKEVRILTEYKDSENTKEEKKEETSKKDDPLNLPLTKYGNYTKDSKSYLLRKTKDGYSLYEETSTTEDGLEFSGKLFVVEGVVFFEDNEGQRTIANFSPNGDLTIEIEGGNVVYVKGN